IKKRARQRPAPRVSKTKLEILRCSLVRRDSRWMVEVAGALARTYHGRGYSGTYRNKPFPEAATPLPFPHREIAKKRREGYARVEYEKDPGFVSVVPKEDPDFVQEAQQHLKSLRDG